MRPILTPKAFSTGTGVALIILISTLRESDAGARPIFASLSVVPYPTTIAGILLLGVAFAIFHFLRKRLRMSKYAGIEDQLEQSQGLETLGQLTGGITHDFNNILSIILGYCEMALDDAPEGSRIRNNVEGALKAGYRAKDLAQQLLTFSRGTPTECRPVDIAPTVEDALRLLRTSLPETVQIRKEINLNAGIISADTSQIHQVMMNLCLNARDAMGETGGELRVKLDSARIDTSLAALHDLEAGPCVELTISDTGCGMPPDVLAHIFEPFFTTKPSDRGTGMGLAVVHGIVKSHTAAITVSSQPGKGTTFRLLFPQVEGQAVADRPTPTPHSEMPPLSRGMARILFVDDEEALTQLCQQMLERLGYDVVAKTDSRDALETFRAQPDRFDLVVTDYLMPDLTGADLAQKVKDIRPDIPLILITGFGRVITPEKAREIGFNAFLLKPMAARDLGGAVHRVLNRQN